MGGKSLLFNYRIFPIIILCKIPKELEMKRNAEIQEKQHANYGHKHIVLAPACKGRSPLATAHVLVQARFLGAGFLEG